MWETFSPLLPSSLTSINGKNGNAVSTYLCWSCKQVLGNSSNGSLHLCQLASAAQNAMDGKRKKVEAGIVIGIRNSGRNEDRAIAYS